ncbi:MAG: hypothetical protein ACREC4_09575 [Methylocella sp.]
MAYYSVMDSLSNMLRGGDRRSIGQSDAVVASVRRAPERAEELRHLLADDDPIIRTRAADAAEKLSRDDPSLIGPCKKLLLERTLDDGTAEVRWHLIQMMARLRLDANEAEDLMAYFAVCFRDDPSRIVRVTALQAAGDLAARHSELGDEFGKILRLARNSPRPSLRARAKKLSARQ